MRRLAAFAALACAVLAAGAAYPPAPRGDAADDYHGTRIADPWRWLEDTASAATGAWIGAQNALVRERLDELPERRVFVRLLGDFLAGERFGLPEQRAGTLVYRYNDGRAQLDSLWTVRTSRGSARVLVDAASLSPDGTVSIADFALSPDGRTLAWAASTGGSDWDTWRFRDVASGRDLPDVLGGSKFSAVAWRADSRGVFYSRYPRATAGDGYDDQRPVAVWHHRLGTAQADDAPVYALPGEDARNPYAVATDDGRYLVMTLFDGYEFNSVHVSELDRGGLPTGPARRLFEQERGLYAFLGNRGPVLYFSTSYGAPTGRIVAVDLRQPAASAWREVVPAGREAIETALLAGDRLVVQVIDDVRSALRLYRLDGRRAQDVVLPGVGSIDGLVHVRGSTSLYFNYTDFATPPAVFQLDARTGRVAAWRSTLPGRAVPPLEVRRVFYPGRDGTRIPMTIVQRRDLPTQGVRPTVLYGYGGFNVSLLPQYSAARLAWVAAGGTYAEANLRGGGEYGEAWHLAGTRLNKQVVFDDFIAAAEWLQAQQIADPRTLAIWGASNGGLLVGAVLNQRPELFAAAVPAVGVMDMLRYHRASANARQWSSDFGIAEDPAEFRALAAYSPYHNVRPGACYPAVLVMADSNDDRVSPWHSYKYGAALQAAQGCDRPVLVRIDSFAGHGAGASRSRKIDEYADQWAFVARATGLTPADSR